MKYRLKYIIKIIIQKQLPWLKSTWPKEALLNGAPALWNVSRGPLGSNLVIASLASPSFPWPEAVFRLSHKSSTHVPLSTTESLYCLRCFAVSALAFSSFFMSLTSPLFLSYCLSDRDLLESVHVFLYASLLDSLKHSSPTLSLRLNVFGWFCCSGYCWGCCWFPEPCPVPSLYV